LHLKLLTAITILVFCSASTALVFAQNDDKIVVFHTCTSYAGFDEDAGEQIDNVGYCTEPGRLMIELFFDDAPNTAESFLKLAESDYYTNTIFHRIIPGFMIQGGDPNSKNWSFPSEWGKGGEKYGGGNLKAEFNNINHDRGIVSMARSAHQDSAGSQFFIVHEKSTHLDGQYTVFGRIITQESYDTLDMVANLEVASNGKPLEPLLAEIKKTEIITTTEFMKGELILNLPERGNWLPAVEKRYSNAEYGFSFMPQREWLHQPTPGGPGDPVLMAIGAKQQGMTPSITYEALETNDTTFKEYFAPRLEGYHELDDPDGTFHILSEEYFTTNAGYNGLEIVAVQITTIANPNPDIKQQMVQEKLETTVKFKQVMLEGTDFHYVISYANHIDYFDDGLVSYDKIIDSFLITTPVEADTIPVESDTTSENDVIVLEDKSFNETENGGCLIATATFGTEMAPQVQILREIRDNIVLQTESGTSFMMAFNQFYYSFSPTIADYERENPVFKEAVKLALTPLLTSLTLLQFVDIDSESEMLGYGIGVILLNVGIYFVIPAAFIMKIRKLQ
jgi:peptidyl-prolyl cis-trans isomerase B (cyclophilin B)